jgi:hypothetical protein
MQRKVRTVKTESVEFRKIDRKLYMKEKRESVAINTHECKNTCDKIKIQSKQKSPNFRRY